MDTDPTLDDLDTFQGHVADWHFRTFGPDCPPWAVALKLAEEAGEVCRAVLEADYPSVNGTGRTADVAQELGDVVIACAALADRLGIFLSDAAESRWQTVRQR